MCGVMRTGDKEYSPHVVVWSGGADSTALLEYYSQSSCKAYPVIALTVRGMLNINPGQFVNQRIVQERFKRWAKRHGRHIEYSVITIGKAPIPCNSQSIWWLCHLFPYIRQNMIVHFGYIRGDDFWHFKGRFVQAFNALCVVGSEKDEPNKAKLEFDYEWTRKKEVLVKLREAKVPGNCWWTCEGSTSKKACGKCNKCRELADAMREEN